MKLERALERARQEGMIRREDDHVGGLRSRSRQAGASRGVCRASLENARNTIQEPGNLRFDVLQQADDPDRFVLYEVYRDEAGAKAHKETPHYARWAEAVAPGWPSRGGA